MLIDQAMADVEIAIRVTPKASANRIVVETAPDGSERLRIYVTTVPENGKANRDVLRLLAKHLDIPPSSLEIIRGSTGRDKIVRFSRD
ncbi:DUF167 domain-containing protein [Beijerinckia indica]|uniref:UPF0235 protein Bind_3579 n=1 Tax=Beijerinckia indica subsp. indica (strain ATCC 9039 / DSM 1715 / NCIMB 8712) TaxID=395963 RepID=B2IG61_BEII9|nr:DUF167 domain-containing protein [Beijerinckia indica]ACB97135.1 protein of unknown function DUF167 [Beijerinckia indica subsp. indica ATCC 9039]